jgi:cell division initiation protein
MALTPVEIRHLAFGRRLFGYRRSAVDRALSEVADSFEDVWRDRADLADKIEHLEGEIVRYRELEALLRTTLISAERAAQELKEQARRESELVVNEAHSEARAITRDAHSEHERLLVETRKVRALLQSALATVEQAAADGPPPEGEEERAGWQDEDEEHEGDPWQTPDDSGHWGAAA